MTGKDVGPPSGAQADGGFTIETGAGGIIRVVGSGFWSSRYVDDHFERLRQVIAAARIENPRIDVLVDLRRSGIQAPETVERLGAGAMSTYQPGDRIAIVLGSCLAKMRMRRTIRTSEHEFFVSPDAALTWLLAYR